MGDFLDSCLYRLALLRDSLGDGFVKNPDSWKPSKFVPAKSGWTTSSDHKELGRASRLIGSIQCEVYYRLIRQHVRGRLLDHGCGKVPLYGMYRDLADEVVCIDWGTSLHETSHVDHFVDLNERMPFPDQSFDTILSNDVLEHLKEPDLAWGEMTRVLRPSGKAIVTVPFLYHLHEEPHDYHRFTAYKLRDFCAKNELTILELEPYGGGLEVVLDIVGKHIYRHKTLSDTHLKMSKWLRKLRPVKALSEDKKKEFPLGYALVAQKPGVASYQTAVA